MFPVLKGMDLTTGPSCPGFPRGFFAKASGRSPTGLEPPGSGPQKGVLGGIFVMGGFASLQFFTKIGSEPCGCGGQSRYGIPAWLGLVNSPPILEPILLGIGMFTELRAFNPWPYLPFADCCFARTQTKILPRKVGLSHGGTPKTGCFPAGFP